jgi:hypothetical protein
MPVDEAALAAELMRRHGVTTMARLERLGVGRRIADDLVRKGRFTRPGNGVVVSTAWPDTLEHRMAIACALTAGVVMFPTAGTAWRLRKTPRSPVVHLWVAFGRRVRARAGICVHYTRHLPHTDIVHRDDGIDITSPPRTAFDAATMLDVEDLESLVEHGIDLGYFIVPTLQRVCREAGRRGRAGTARFAEVLDHRPAWRRPARSDHELRLERAMRRRGFPPLVREPRVVLLDGEVIHPDLGLPDDGFFVEVDHLTWHGRRRRSADDRRRDLKARAGGLHVERVSDIALDEDLDGTVENLWIQWTRLAGGGAASS